MRAGHVDIGCRKLRRISPPISDKCRFQVDRGAILGFGSGVAVINRRSVYRDIATLLIVFKTRRRSRRAKTTRTPYDSPAMWKARPLNCENDSKKRVTKASMSFAPSSVVSTVWPYSAYENPTPTL